MRVGDRRVRHRLLVVRAVGRQRVAMRVQRLADARDVAVAEDREHAAEERRDAVRRLRAQRREIADQRLRRRQADVVIALCAPCAARVVATRRSAPRSSRAPARFSVGVVDRRRRATPPPAPGRSCGRPRSRGTCGSRARRGSLRPASSTLALSPSSTTPRQCGSRSAISASIACHCAARHRLELPPLRIDAEVVEALQRAAARCRGARGSVLRRNDLEQQLVPARLHGVVERADLRLLLEPVLDRVVGMVVHEALDDVLRRAS